MKRLSTAIVAAALFMSCEACMDIASANSCSTGGITNLINSLPAGGGTINLSSCGSMSLTGPIAYGTETAPVTLRLGAGTITFTNTTGNGFVIGGSGSGLIGSGPLQTVLTTNSGFTGDVVHVEPVAGSTIKGVADIELAGFGCDATPSPTAICIEGVSVRQGSSFHNLRLFNMSGTALELTTSAVSGGRISNITSVRDVFIQTSSNALTADTVIIRGDAIQFDSNNTIYSPAPHGPFRGLVISPTATTQGDGRGNNIAHSVIEGYGTCLSIESPTGPNTGAIGNVIMANWFEACDLAYQITGADPSHMAESNQAFGNYFASTTIDTARLDFADDNFVQETTHGTPGTITLTSNSINNSVDVRLGLSTDVANFGTGNTVFTTLGKSSTISGDLHVGGTISKSAGSFRIDHPLYPKAEYLQHSFVESPDMMNIYNGVVKLDKCGNAEVVLPAYFEALNRDFRYQLTPIGGFAPVYVAQEIKHNIFKIAGGKPSLRVSWQVTGVRHDAYADKHRIAVETPKTQ